MNFARYLYAIAGHPQAWALDTTTVQAILAALDAYRDTGAEFTLTSLGIPHQSMTATVRTAFKFGDGKPTSSGEVNVQKIHGVMTKDSGYCGEPGTLQMADSLYKADSRSNIVAHVLDISSPGGEAAGLDTLYQVVAGLSKPVVAYVNEQAASGGYYAAAAADQIILSGKAAQVGSIGVVLEYLDGTRAMNNKGYDMVSVTADKSTNKRAINFSQPTDADKQRMRELMLNPINEVFHESVKATRPNVTDHALTGAMFHGQEAINNGLADSFGTLHSAIAAAYNLSLQ